ncbi:uncharacterized protein MYCFIDRAFT_85332, partial [Pseudocercospora fijiensis CIRAD86]
MLHSTNLIPLLILLSGVTRVRTAVIQFNALEADPPPPNTRTCAGKPYTSGWAFYSTTIIVHYANGIGCENVKNHLIVTIGETSSPKPQLQNCDVTPGGRSSKPAVEIEIGESMSM